MKGEFGLLEGVVGLTSSKRVVKSLKVRNVI